MINNIHGNIFEALIGAIYMDKGHAFCQKFIYQNIINEYAQRESESSEESQESEESEEIEEIPFSRVLVKFRNLFNSGVIHLNEMNDVYVNVFGVMLQERYVDIMENLLNPENYQTDQQRENMRREAITAM